MSNELKQILSQLYVQEKKLKKAKIKVWVDGRYVDKIVK